MQLLIGPPPQKKKKKKKKKTDQPRPFRTHFKVKSKPLAYYHLNEGHVNLMRVLI